VSRYVTEIDICTGYEELIRIDDDGTWTSITTITEPEDRTFGRDLRAVLTELRRLDSALQLALRDQPPTTP
jgi:hypothetical protein